MTKFQAGGVKNKGVVDNVFILRGLIDHSHNDTTLYKILVKVNSDHLDCNPGISPDIKDFKFPAIIISV